MISLFHQILFYHTPSMGPYLAKRQNAVDYNISTRHITFFTSNILLMILHYIKKCMSTVMYCCCRDRPIENRCCRCSARSSAEARVAAGAVPLQLGVCVRLPHRTHAQDARQPPHGDHRHPAPGDEQVTTRARRGTQHRAIIYETRIIYETQRVISSLFSLLTRLRGVFTLHYTLMDISNMVI